MTNLPRQIRKITDRHSIWDVWRDFTAMAAIALANRFEPRIPIRNKREEDYLKIAGKYEKPELQRFAECLGHTALELDKDPRDVLGPAFHDLELHCKQRGQFFSPQVVGDLMAGLTMDTSGEGSVSVHDPALGAGTLAIGAYRQLAKDGQEKRLEVYGQDIDAGAIHMAYMQLSLLGVAAFLVVGDTLRSPMTGADLNGTSDRAEHIWITPKWWEMQATA